MNCESTAAFFGVIVAEESASCRTGIGEPSPTNGVVNDGDGVRLGTLMPLRPLMSARIEPGNCDNWL